MNSWAKTMSIMLAVVVLVAGWAAAAYGAGDITEPSGVPEAWKTMSPAQLLDLSTSLVVAGDTAASDRALLAQYAGFKYLNTATSARSVGVLQWKEFVLNLLGAMPQDLQVQLRDKLRSAFAADQAAVVGLSETDFLALVDPLRRLGDPQVGSVVIWRATGKYFVDAAAPRLLTLDKWLVYVSCASDILTAEAKRDWAARIRTAYVADQAAAAALSDDDFGLLVHILEGLGDTGIAELHLWWVSGKYLTDAATIRSVGLARWQNYAWLCGKTLTGDLKLQWAAKIRAAYTGDAAALAVLKGEDFMTLVTFLEGLGDSNTAPLFTSWMAAGDNWKSCDGYGFNVLANKLAGLGEQAAPQRAALAERLTGLCTAEPAKAVAMGCDRWGRLAHTLPAGAVSAQVRLGLAAGLRSAFGNPAALGNLRSDELQTLVDALDCLGDMQIKDLVLQGMKASEAWRSGDLAWYLVCLPSSGEEALAARKQVIAQIETDYLASPENIRRVGLVSWHLIATSAGEVLTPETRLQWAGKLRAAYLGSAPAGGLSLGDFTKLAETLAALGDKGATVSAQAWLAANQDHLGDCPLSDLAFMVGRAAEADRSAIVPVLDKLEAALLARQSSPGLALDDYGYVCQIWVSVGDKTRAKAWANRMYAQALGSDEARAKADAGTLTGVVMTMLRADAMKQLGGEEEYPGFAAAAARLAREGKLDDLPDALHSVWGCALQMPQSRAALQAELVDAQGNPRLSAAKIVGWAYWYARKAPEWRALVNEKLAAGNLNGDTKARWLLVRAYGEGSTYHDEERLRIRGEQTLKEALAAAVSSDVKLAVLKELSQAYVEIARFEAATGMLDSVANQFSGTPQADQITALKQNVEQARAKYLAERARRFGNK